MIENNEIVQVGAKPMLNEHSKPISPEVPEFMLRRFSAHKLDCFEPGQDIGAYLPNRNFEELLDFYEMTCRLDNDVPAVLARAMIMILWRAATAPPISNQEESA